MVQIILLITLPFNHTHYLLFSTRVYYGHVTVYYFGGPQLTMSISTHVHVYHDSCNQYWVSPLPHWLWVWPCEVLCVISMCDANKRFHQLLHIGVVLLETTCYAKRKFEIYKRSWGEKPRRIRGHTDSPSLAEFIVGGNCNCDPSYTMWSRTTIQLNPVSPQSHEK